MRPSASHIKVGGVCEVEIHVHQSQLSEDTSGDYPASSSSNFIPPEVSASLMKDKFLVTAITLEDDSEEHFPQSKLNELLKVKHSSKVFLCFTIPRSIIIISPPPSVLRLPILFIRT